MRYSIWGTGSSALDFMGEYKRSDTLVEFIESEPSKSLFMDRPVVNPRNMTWDVDRLYVASQYYPTIVQALDKMGYPLERVEVVVSHRDDPRFGCIRFNAVQILPRLSDYERHSNLIRRINEELDELNIPDWNNRLDHLSSALKAAPPQGLVLEFGVYRGESLLHLAALCDRPVWGFDSFSGFDNASSWDFDTSVRVRAELPEELKSYPYLVPGFFSDTLTPFLNRHVGEGCSFVHYDAGHYDAAKYCLENLRPIFSPGCVVVFDEYVPTPTDLDASEYKV
jgi:hypothetical protein